MRLTADVGVARKCKFKEELCGDAVQVVRTPGQTTVILSDGLGSGVKANIMATLTTKIASGLLQRHVPLEHVIATIADTLPVCRVRGLAYATFSILQVQHDGKARLYEYDSPPVHLFRKDLAIPLERKARVIHGKRVLESTFELLEGDFLLMVSDGVIHAGVGEAFDLGLGEDGLLHFLTAPCTTWHQAEDLADFVIDLASSCYHHKFGDDSTAVVLRIRPPRGVAVLTGPPLDPMNDAQMVRSFMSLTSYKKIVCGGTSASIVSKALGVSLETSIDYVDPRVPPIATMSGIDLVTEGVLTLNRSYELLRGMKDGGYFPRSQDGATLLAKELWNAEEVHFLVGKSFNQAHANIEELMQLAPRQYIITRLVDFLRKRSIRTEISYF